MMVPRRGLAHRPFVGVAVGLLTALSLSGCASSAPVEVPPADYDRAATWQTHMVACLQEEGWEVVAIDDGSLNFAEGGLPSSQYEKYADSVQTCELSSGLPTWDDLSEAQRRGNYQLVAENAQCLRDQGYDIPADPSFQKYEEDQAAWTPFADLDVSADELDNLEKVCPQPIGW